MIEQAGLQWAVSLGQLLQARGQRLALAESCTGGGVAYVVTHSAGSSLWFDRGFVTYSNQAKQELLGVPAHILQQQGAVSEATVAAMVEGVLANSQAQAALAISGIAGPGGGSELKPVGTVWFGFGYLDQRQQQLCQFAGDREAVRLQACEFGLRRLYEWVARGG